MNTKVLIFRTSCIASAMVVPVFAIEAPADDQPGPALRAQQAADSQQTLQLEDLQAAKNVFPAPGAAFLGVVTGAVPEALAEHLNLQPDHGILVLDVSQGSPSSTVGLSKNDIITQIDGKPIASTETLTACIKEHNPNDTIKIDYIHRGQTQSSQVTLAERPADLPPVAEMDPHIEKLRIGGIPDEFAERIQRMIEGNIGNIDPKILENLENLDHIEDNLRQFQQSLPQSAQDILQLQQQIQDRLKRAVPGEIIDENAQTSQAATIRLMDQDGSLELSSENGKKSVTVRDANDNVVWNGPWNSEKEKSAAPDTIRKRIDRLQLGNGPNGLQLRLGGP